MKCAKHQTNLVQTRSGNWVCIKCEAEDFVNTHFKDEDWTCDVCTCINISCAIVCKNCGKEND